MKRNCRELVNQDVPQHTNGLRPPVATMVYQCPVSREKPEGMAVLIEQDQSGSDVVSWRGKVRFYDEPDRLYYRTVWRGDTLHE